MAEAAASPVVFWIVIGAYLVFLAVAGIKAKQKTHTFEDFMVAGRKIGPVLLGLSFGVTYFSAVMIVGGGEFSWLWGLSAVWIAVADTIIGVFAMFVFFGKRTMRLSYVTDSLTVSEMLGKRYDSDGLRKFTALVTLIFETVYLVSIYMGLSILLSYAMPDVDINISYTIAVIVCGAITVVYLNIGGAHGAITTDVVEAIIMLVGVVAICLSGISKVGGLETLITRLETIAGGTGLTTSPPGTAPWGWVGYILVTSFGVWGMPQLVSRYFTTKKRKSLRWGLVISTVWALIVSLFAWWNGAIGRVLNEDYPEMFIDSIADPASVLPAMMNLLLGVFAPVFVAAVTAASLTTGEKVIMVASSAFTRDFYQPITKCDDNKAMKVSKITNIFVVLVGVLLALLKPDAVLALCMFAWSALASTVLVPYIFGLFWKKGTAKAAILSGAIALFMALFWKIGVRGLSGIAPAFMPAEFTGWGFEFLGMSVTMAGTHEFIVSQITALIAFPIVSLLTQKDHNMDYVNKMFDRMNEVTPDEIEAAIEEPKEPVADEPKSSPVP